MPIKLFEFFFFFSTHETSFILVSSGTKSMFENDFVLRIFTHNQCDVCLTAVGYLLESDFRVQNKTYSSETIIGLLHYKTGSGSIIQK